MEVPLVAGRFAPLAGSFAFDLGTGERAYLMLESLHGRFAPPAWAERCAALSGLWHPAMAECLDFGSLGEEHRFVAFRVVRQLAGLRTCASFERTRSQVDAFLAACGLDSRALNTPFNDGAERLVSVPAIEPENLQRSNVTRTIADAGRWFGVRLVQRSALQTVREYLDAGTTPGMRIQHVEAPRGSGGRTFLRWCAREARRCGYIPLGGAALHWILRQPMERADEWMAMLARHNIVLLHDGRERRFNEDLVLVRALLRLGTREARPSCIVLELTASGGPQGRLHLARLSERELIDMIVASDVSKREGQVIAGAARTSQGRPGPFIKRVATLFAGRSAEDPPAGYTVHERSLCYGASIDSRRVPEPPRPQPMRQDVTDSATVREIHTAMALRAKGRHAAADRALRHAEAAASRRGRWASAAMAAMSLARLRAERGEIVAAEKIVLQTLEYSERAQDLLSTVIAAVELGRLRLQDARIEQAESSLRTALTASGMAQDGAARRWCATWLAVCLWWQGRYEEASRVLQNIEPVLAPQGAPRQFWQTSAYPTSAAIDVIQECTAGRVALALHDPSSARARLVHAADLAVRWGDAGLVTVVRRVEARWHAAVGDIAGFRKVIEDATRAARAARQPLARLCALVVYLEGCLTLELHDPALPLMTRRLEHAAGGRLPGLLAFRIRVALARLRGSLSAEQITASCHARRLAAIHMDMPVPGGGSVSSPVRSRMYDDVIEVLRVCQEEEPIAALRGVVDIVRARTRAIAVEFTSVSGVTVVACGSAVGTTSAGHRSIETALPIEPIETARGIEAAVPVRFASRIVGALASRWEGASPLETPRLMGLLKAVAAAAAPCLGVLLEQQARESRLTAGLELLGNSHAMENIRRAVVRAADAPYPVLIQGESGSGKELVARAIHRASTRRTRPLSALNCAALPDDLLEAELFGHARGAFTGAIAERAGLFEEASGGVLFLDEVGELTPRAQAKLLRAIQEGEIKRIGETFPRKIDVRIVAATNRALDQEVGAGRFRADLRYRLDVVRIVVPPLRERPEDIAALVQHFWKIATERVGSRAALGGSATAALARYDWPGNVRELQNVLASLAVAAPRRGVVGPSALPAAIASNAARQSGATLESARRVFEERYVRAALARSGGHRGRAAAELGLSRQGLAKLMGRLGVSHSTDPASALPQSRVS